MNGKGGCIHLSILIQLFMFVKLYILNPDVPLQTVFIAFLLRGDDGTKVGLVFVFFFLQRWSRRRAAAAAAAAAQGRGAGVLEQEP